jgi:hypothetical protein
LAWLQRLLKRPPVGVRSLLGGEKLLRRTRPVNGRADPSLAMRAIFSARGRLLEWNEAPAPPIRVPPQLRREIGRTLAGEVALLSRLIGRDLGHWVDGQAGAAIRDATGPVPAPAAGMRGRAAA